MNQDYKSLALAIIVVMIITALSSFKGKNSSNQMDLNHNDSLTLTEGEYAEKALTYNAHAGDTLKLAVINLDVPYMKTLVDIVLSQDDKMEFKIKDLFSSVPDHSFIVIKINSDHYYKDIYTEKYRIF